MAGQVEHDAAGELDHAHRPQIGGGAEKVLLEIPEEERPVAALQADLVVVDDGAEPPRGAHDSVSDGRTCLGRRR